MDKVRLNEWVIEIDVEKTREQYQKTWDLCDCLYCLNFYEAMKQRSEIEYSFFNKLGINPSRSVHMSHFDPDSKDNKHFYIGCYHIVGKISEETPAKVIKTAQVINVSDDISVWFTKQLEFVPGNFERPVLQLDFQVHLPWVLEEVDEH